MKLPTLFSPLLALALAAPLGAQVSIQGWIGDDGFNVPCCTPVQQTNVPLFPAFQIDGVYCCIKDCDLEAEFRVNVTTQHIPIVCDVALIPFSVTPIAGSGGPGWVGTLIAKYARTWVELDPNGVGENQIWRWLVNTDAFPTAGATPCPIPPHPAGLATHFTGHIDYACTLDAAGNLEFRMAMNLNHLPGCITHNQFSASPLLGPPFADGHHERSYHLAAPGSFVCEPVPPPEGPTPAEAVRSTLLPPLPYTCLGEAPVEFGDLIPGIENCLCSVTLPPPTGPFRWYHQFLRGIVLCPPGPIPIPFSYSGIPVGPPAPPLPTGFTTFPLGSWVGLDSFPGTRQLSIHFGLLNYMDPCQPNQPPFHIVSGVSTRSINPGFIFGGLDPTTNGPYSIFMDLENMILANGLFGPYSLGFGTWFLSSVVWNLNID